MLQTGSLESGASDRCVNLKSTPEWNNGWIAERLRQAASLLAAQGANPFRVSAYRRAGNAIGTLDVDVRDVAEASGHTALEAIPGVVAALCAGVMPSASGGMPTSGLASRQPRVQQTFFRRPDPECQKVGLDITTAAGTPTG